MFDRNYALGICLVLGTATGCEPKKGTPAPQAQAPTPIERRDGPAYIVSPPSGILPIFSDDHILRRLPLARHRPGRSDLWIDGIALGHQPTPWRLERDSLVVPLSGAMVHGLHDVALVTAQYEQYPRSAPLLIAVSPAAPRAIEFYQEPALREDVARLYYPGKGALFGAQLAWHLRAREGQETALELMIPGAAAPLQLKLAGEHPPLEQAYSVAIHHQKARTQVLAVYPEDPKLLWHWSINAQDSQLSKIPVPDAGLVEALFVDERGFWLNHWRGRSRLKELQRPGDRQVLGLGLQDTTLRPAQAQDYGQSAQIADLQVAGTLKTLSPSGAQTHLTLAIDSWLASSGPISGTKADLYAWKQDPRVGLRQRCAVQSPLLDEIWVGLDPQARLRAGSRRGASFQSQALKDPGPPRLAPGPLPLDCGVVQGRFVAVAPRPNQRLPLLHFDGARMHERQADVSCQDAAFTGWGEKTRLWCLHEGSLFRMTLQWQDPKAKR